MNALFTVAIMLVIFMSIQLWILAAIRVSRGDLLLAPEPRPETPWGLSDILVAVFLQMLVHSFAHELFRRKHELSSHFQMHELGIDTGSSYVALMAWASLAAMALTIGWLAIRHQLALTDLGLQWRRIGIDILLGIRTFAMLAPVVYGIQLILVQFVRSEHPLIEMLKKNPSPRFFVMSGFAAVLVAPIVEEFFFRLLLQGWFERLASGRDNAKQIFFGGRQPVQTSQPGAGTSPEVVTAALVEDGNSSSGDIPARTPVERKPWWTIAASALLFALAHAANGPDPVPLFVLAIGLGYLYQRTHRIVPAITVHMLLNASTLAMMWLAMSTGEVPD